jgi:ATP-dependent helicase/nuclease subunit A
MEQSSGVNLGALYGTAIHRVMACMNFKGYLEVDRNSDRVVFEYVEKEIHRMLEDSLLTEEMYQLINPYAVTTFMKTEIALQMAHADARGDLFREKPFVMDYDGALMQGIIDVFWLEEQKIVLLDYKTDRVNSADELVARYKTQLELYEKALKKIFSTEEHVIEEADRIIYSFRLKEVIVIS